MLDSPESRPEPRRLVVDGKVLGIVVQEVARAHAVLLVAGGVQHAHLACVEKSSEWT